MRVLLAIISCHSREEFSNAVRCSWKPLVPAGVEVIFFRGRGTNRAPKSDEIFLDCGDSYQDLPEKVKAIMQWAYERGYDFVLKCDDDVVIKPKELLSSGFDKYDFTGCMDPKVVPGEIRTPWGFCYWLSRRSMKLIVEAPLPGQPGSTHSYHHNNDEAWISTVLYINNIFLQDDQRYYLHRGFIPEKVRPLRTPKRPRPRPVDPISGTFAWCIYIDAGLHNLPASMIIDEFVRIFEANK